MSRLAASLAILIPLTLLGACATAGPPPGQDPVTAESDLPPPPAGSSPFGLFLAGQAAMNDGDNSQAARYFGQASNAGLDGAYIQQQAFVTSLLAGDITRAAKLAPNADATSPVFGRLGLLTKAVEALASGDGKGSLAILSADGGIGYPFSGAGALLKPWAAAAAGDMKGASISPVDGGDRIVAVFGQLGQASLYERMRRYDEAETDYKALASLNGAGTLFVADYGEFLERRGRSADALALYDQALAEHPADAGLQRARARAAAKGKAPAMLSYRQGAARAMVAAAAGLISEKQSDLAMAYLRLSLRLDPERDETWVLVGALMEDRKNLEGARVAYSHVRLGSPQWVSAQTKLAWSYQGAGDNATALKLVEAAVAAAPNDQTALINQADLYRANERYEDSVRVLDGVIARQGATPDWRLLYMRGVSLQAAGRWPDAERDLKTALAQSPNEPELLNFLGYSWIDRGEHLDEALDMVKRAVAANPRSGAIVDSLGWAYYRLGDYKNAVAQLEAAVELDAADPEINNHLGDAYWQIGRKVEARYQWSRVLTLQPDAKIKAQVEAKLKDGLAPAAPVKSRVAGN
ncbi:Flp pilus assembly protein TadD [Caulobacter ginsengisoli]|uniref:Flp pilus assembly protein TadD n=1 Tax=Caulobacter ginsengisoli TaxID=400775 RepID=A0ABU0IPK7_9CAUL|nr:tetratricopeptide repeat protein [Caulobacter ginsengisoli]MDQ0463894.1 Flp pilus assembly protein TadD [Caulobacter ginsengisoli]